jgi:hypothetical protein
LVVEVVFVDLDVPDVRTVTAAVDDHVSGLPPELGGLGWHLAAWSAAVDADDGVGHRHPPTVAQIAVNGAIQRAHGCMYRGRMVRQTN